MTKCTTAFFAGCLVLGLARNLAPAEDAAGPPMARRVPFEETLHGVTLSDPYHWLEDFDSPEAAAFIDGQDRFARARLALLPGQDFLRHRLTELTRSDSLSVPTVAGGRYFYAHLRAGADLPVFCVRKGFDGPEEVLLDPATLSADHSANVDLADVSRDGELAAFEVRQSGQDEVEIRFREVGTRRDLEDRRGRRARRALFRR